MNKQLQLFGQTLLFLLLVASGVRSSAQTVTTGLPISTSSGAGAGYFLTFIVDNTNGYPIVITDIEMYRASGANGNTLSLYYSSTSLSGVTGVTPPATFATAPAWTSVTSVVASTVTTTAIHPTFTGLSVVIPANTVYRFAVQTSGSSLNYGGAANTPNSFSNGGVTLGNGNYVISGSNVGYWGSTTPRFWCGSVTFAPYGPCTSPPTAGNATASNATPCTGSSVDLNLVGNTGGAGQTYQWQTGPSATGPWTNVGGILSSAAYTTTVSATAFYRAGVTCGTTATVYSSPIQLAIPALFPAGTYTINSGAPASATNFISFSAAAAAIRCGTTGSVIFNVAPGSGPYNERVVLADIPTTSPTNSITFNCNDVTMTASTAGTTSWGILTLDGTDYVRIKRLKINNTLTTNSFGLLLTDGANNNVIDSCTIDMGQAATASTVAGILIGSSALAATTGTIGCDSNVITNNTVIGGYYAVTSVGVSTDIQFNNIFANNTIRDYYVYGFYAAYNNGLQFIENDLHRTNRTTLSTFYGVNITTGCLRSNISRNKIHNPFTVTPTSTGTGYYLYNGASATAGNENVFSNNIIYNVEGNGTQYLIYAVGNYGRYYYNTVSSDYTAATAGITYGYYQASNYTGVEVKNNIFSITRGGPGIKYAVYQAATGYTAIINNNDYYVTGDSTRVGYNGTNHFTLAAWQASSSQDAASVSVNPVFTAATSGDLKPTATSINNLGTPIAGINIDITGASRNPVTPDMGAFEFGPPFCSAPTNLTASGVTATTATLTWTAVTGAAGYEYVLDNTAANPAGAGTATTAVTYSAGPLLPLTTYYMHVRTNCGTGFSSWETISFITLCAPPVATITAAGPTTFCQPGSVVLNANTGTGLSYQWKSGTANITGATSASYTATTSGSYTVVTSISTCNTTSSAVTVTVNSKPDTNVTMNPASGNICPGNSAQLSAVAATGNTYQWFKDGTPIPSATAATYSATAAGDYRVLITNSTSCSDTSQIHTVTIIAAPVSTITPSGPLSFCQGDSALISGPAIVTGNTYQWQLNGSDISGATTDFMYAKTAGTYRLLLSNGTCTDTSVGVVVNVNTLPTIVVSPTTATTVCAGVAVPLTASGAVSYAWTPTTYLSATTGANVTSTPNATITYTVTGTDANGCVNTGNKLITVNPRPVLSFTPALATVCSGGSVVITANGASTYAWSPATGLNTTTGAIVTSTPTATITYTVTGTSAAGCVATATKQVVFTTTPNVVVSPTSATTVCAGVATTLTATGATTYSWSPATGLSATTGASVVATPLTTTTYTITGTTNGCPGTTTKLITVNPLPTAIATAGGNTNFCQGGSVVLSANTGTGLTYQWRLNSGNIPGATSANYTASASGTYDVVVSNGTCPATSNSIIVIVSTPPAPVVSVIGTPSVCQGGFITLSTAINAAYTYQWKRNSVNIAGANAASYNATTGGDYSVEVTNGTCVVTSAPVTIMVNALPPAAILPAGPTTFCEGGALVMHASIDPAFNYEWRNGGIPIPGAVSATYIANATGNYSVKVSDATCSAISPEIDVRVIAVPLTPTITLTGGNVLSTGNYITYQWYRNGTAIPGATAQTHTALQDGNYTVMVTNFAGCEATAAAVAVSSVGVPTVGKASVSIYPNPASDKVYIESAQAVNVSVRSVDGKEVLNTVNAKEINIHLLADGVYILRITNNAGQLLKTERLVKTAR